MDEVAVADLSVHIDDPLSPTDRARLEEKLRNEDGVITACVAGESPHVLTITYYPQAISSRDLLSRINRFGLHAARLG